MEGAVRFFPLFIDMNGKNVLMIGGGKIAERRAITLCSFGADIVIISPAVTESINQLVISGNIRHINRAYISGDVKEMSPFLVIAATDSRVVNNLVMHEAKANNILAVISDCREECSSYFPAIAESDDYIAGIVSKTGNHSGVKETAKRLRRWLDGE